MGIGRIWEIKLVEKKIIGKNNRKIKLVDI